MSYSSPPNTPSPRDESRNRDEWVAVLIALLTMGGIIFWVMGKEPRKLNLGLSSFPEFPTLETSVSDKLTLSDLLEESVANITPDSQGSEISARQPINGSLNPLGGTVTKPIIRSKKFGSTSTGVLFPFLLPKSERTPDSSEETPSALTETPPASETELPVYPDGSVVPDEQVTSASPEPEAEASPEATASPEPEVAASPEATASPEPEVAASPEATASPTPGQPEAEASPEATASPTPTTPVVIPLPVDVSQDYWAKDFVGYVTTQNIMNPDDQGNFQPDKPVTRGELAAQIENAFVPEDKRGTLSYSDVEQDYWASDEIQDVTKSGFMTGYPGEIFRPEQTVPRVQVLVALASGLDLKPAANPQETLKIYKDADQIPEWAVEKVAAATEAGLVVSHPNTDTLNPNEPTSRAEAAAMIYQALVEADKAKPIKSDYIIQPRKKGFLQF